MLQPLAINLRLVLRGLYVFLQPLAVTAHHVFPQLSMFRRPFLALAFGSCPLAVSHLGYRGIAWYTLGEPSHSAEAIIIGIISQVSLVATTCYNHRNVMGEKVQTVFIHHSIIISF